MKIQVWWVPQVPGKAFKVDVETLNEGIRLCNTLAKYDFFQFDNNIKPDYCNAGGIEITNDAGVATSYDPDDEYDMEEARAVISEYYEKLLDELSPDL
jgi:hypothetical protein